MKEKEHTVKTDKPKKNKAVKNFPLIKWVGFKGDTKELKKITNQNSVTRAIETAVKNTINKQS